MLEKDEDTFYERDMEEVLDPFKKGQKINTSLLLVC